MAEKKRQALQLRLEGASYREIARTLGWKDHSSAYAHVQESMQAIVQEPAEELRTLELERLDADYLALAPAARKGDVSSILARLRIMERRAKYTGLDKPILVDIRERLVAIAIEGGMDPDEAIAEAQQLIAANERLRGD